MVVRLAGQERPFMHDPAVALGPVHVSLAAMCWAKSSCSRACAEEGQAARVAGGGGQGGVRERLPVVHVRRHVRELSGLAHVGDVPVVADGLAGPAGVAAHRLGAGPDAQALVEHHRRAAGLVLDGGHDARLVAHVHQQPVDSHQAGATAKSVARYVATSFSSPAWIAPSGPVPGNVRPSVLRAPSRENIRSLCSGNVP